MAGLNDDVDDDDFLSDNKTEAKDYKAPGKDITEGTKDLPQSPPVTFVVSGEPTDMEETPTVNDLFGDVIEPGKLPNLELTAVFNNEIPNQIEDASSVFQNIKGFGAISRSDILAFESIMPGIITEDTPATFYTESPTKTMFDKSVALMSSQISSLSNTQKSACIAGFKELQEAVEKTQTWIGKVNIDKAELRKDHVLNMVDLIDKNPAAQTYSLPGFERSAKDLLGSSYEYLGGTSGFGYSRSEGQPLIYSLAIKAYSQYKDKSLQKVLNTYASDNEITEDTLNYLFGKTPPIIEEGEQQPTIRQMLSFTGSDSERDLFNSILGILEDVSKEIETKLNSLNTEEVVLSDYAQSFATLKNSVLKLSDLSIKIVQFEHINIEFVKCLLNVLYGAVESVA